MSEEELTPEEESEELELEHEKYQIVPKNDGFIHFGYNTTSGDFEVLFDTFDLSDNSADTLALILMLLANGKMNTYIGEAMGIWTEDDDAKHDFVKNVLEKIEYYDLLLAEKDEKPIVRPSQVFNMDKQP